MARRITVAVTRHLLHAVDHALEILRPHLPGILIERPRQLLRIALHLLRQRLHELVERRAQIVREPLDLFVAGAAFERLAQSFLRLPQGLLDLRQVAIFDRGRHVPHAGDDIAQLLIAPGARKLPVNRAQAEIHIALDVEHVGSDRHRVERVEDIRLRLRVKGQRAPLLDERFRDRLTEGAQRQ